MAEEMEPIVLDNGSGLIKAGFSGEDLPRAIIPTCAGKAKNPEWFSSQASNIKADLRDRDTFVGTECQQYREYLDVVNPITRGKIEDWDALERIWEYIFTHELRVQPETTTLPVLCTSSPSGSKAQQEKMAEIMFESQKLCGFYHMHQSALSLFASGRTRGIVVEIGHGSSHVTPIFEGYALPHASLHYNIGGVDISQRLQKILAKRGHSFHSLHIQTINDIKENNCYVGARGEKLTSNNSSEDSNSFELPDGTILTLDKQARMSPPEIIFKPQDLGDDQGSRPSKGIHEFVVESISMCDKDLQKDLYDSVVLAGGTTMMPGYLKRFQNELAIATKQPNISIVPDPNVRERGYNSQRRIAAWVGGSMFGSLSTFRDIHITKQEWEEYHEAILDRKCF